MNVWRRLREIAVRDMTDRNEPGVRQLSEADEETVAVLGLLHDVCKVGVYHQETKRRRNPETKQWEDCLGYTFRDPFPLGHGEKSLLGTRPWWLWPTTEDKPERGRPGRPGSPPTNTRTPFWRPWNGGSVR
nr:HD domain-containing protein [Pseudoflavonifractor sp. 524-17]